MPLAASAATPAPMLSRSAPPPPAGTVKYFAYGANTASSTLARRGVQVLTSRPAVLVDPGTVISFQHRGGFAMLTKAPPEQEADPRLQRGSVHGVVYSLSRTDMAALQRAETGYTLATVRVSTYPPTAACASTATTYEATAALRALHCLSNAWPALHKSAMRRHRIRS